MGNALDCGLVLVFLGGRGLLLKILYLSLKLLPFHSEFECNLKHLIGLR